MLGFTAVATSENIDTSQDSLEHARWFSREELKHFSVNNSVLDTDKAMIECNQHDKIDKGVQYKMSSKDSISSYLITAWLNKEIGQY